MTEPEKTFHAYTATQGQTYDSARSTYNPAFINKVINHHTSTGGQLNTVIDVGCGPGTATRELAPHFSRAIGLDASPGMISAAQGPGIEFRCSSAEKMECDVDDGTVDLITVATAAHWFDMPRFWERAGRLLKSGGSVGIWTMHSEGVHCDTPNWEAVNSALGWIRGEIAQFSGDGNRLARELYVDLGLPWSFEPGVGGFEEESVLRMEFGKGDEGAFVYERWMGMDAFEAVLGTGSPITRWREANPEKVGEEDVVRVMRRKIERLLKEAGVAEEDMAIKPKMIGVLIMVKKK